MPIYKATSFFALEPGLLPWWKSLPPSRSDGRSGGDIPAWAYPTPIVVYNIVQLLGDKIFCRVLGSKIFTLVLPMVWWDTKFFVRHETQNLVPTFGRQIFLQGVRLKFCLPLFPHVMVRHKIFCEAWGTKFWWWEAVGLTVFNHTTGATGQLHSREVTV